MLRIKTLKSGPIARKGAYFFLCVLLLTGSQRMVIAVTNHLVITAGSMTHEAVSQEQARTLVLAGNIHSAIVVYSQLLSKDSTNVLLTSEYAYTLALDGIYDAAMVRLDRIWSQKANNREVNYFASQIFALMGYDQLAGEFWKESEINITPDWISPKANELLEKHKRVNNTSIALSRDELVAKFKHANRLTAQSFSVQSIGLFEEIVSQYPNEYLPYVGYSIALEKAGFLSKSAQTIETALLIVGENPEHKDTKQFLTERLVWIQNKINAQGQNTEPILSSSRATEAKSPQLIAYAGGFIASSYTSLNARFGSYFTQSSYTAVDLGLTSANSISYVNIGLSVYNRQGIFVAGVGLTGSLGDGITALYGKISAGVSFMNKNRTSSLDIFLDGRMPLTKGGVTSMGISVGQSIYFGKRK